VIIAIGFSFMYFSDDAAMAICMGIGYLIASVAIILVIIADGYDRKLKVLFKATR
jgi:hypothetical protein